MFVKIKNHLINLKNVKYIDTLVIDEPDLPELKTFRVRYFIAGEDLLYCAKLENQKEMQDAYDFTMQALLDANILSIFRNNETPNPDTN